METLLVNILLFVSIYIAGFFSILGYGKFFFTSKNINNSQTNFFDLQIFGSIGLLILSYLIYLSVGTSFTINILIFFLGILFYFFYKKKLNKIEIKYLLILLFLPILIIFISKTHEDFNTYHFFSIYEVFNNNLRIGTYNLNDRFFHSSHLIHNQSLFVFPYLNLKMIHLPIFYIYISTLGYFLYLTFLNKNSTEVLYSIFCILILLIKFNRLSEFGYDYIAQFLLLIVFHKIYFLIDDDYEITSGAIIFLFSVLVKPIALLFIPIFLSIFIMKKLNFFLKIIKTRFLTIISLVIILTSSSFFKTGCIFYPVNSTCFSKEKVFWSEKHEIKEYSEMIRYWAKAYYTQDKSKYDKIENKNLYNKNFNWLKFWIEKHFFYKIFEFLIILILCFIITYIYFNKDQLDKEKLNNKKKIFLILSTASIFFWLTTVPQFRFSFSSIIIFSFLIFIFLFNKKIIFNKKKFYHLLILGFLVLNIKNINRITSEFQRDDFYKYKNFPYFNEIEINNDYNKLERSKFFHIEILK